MVVGVLPRLLGLQKGRGIVPTVPSWRSRLPLPPSERRELLCSKTSLCDYRPFICRKFQKILIKEIYIQKRGSIPFQEVQVTVMRTH